MKSFNQYRVNFIMKSLFIIFCCSLLIACGSRISIEDLRYTNNPDNYELSVNKNYQSVYQNVLDTGYRCHNRLSWSLYPVPDRIIVDGKLNRIQKNGYVSFALHPGIVGNIATVALIVVDISAIDKENTKVVVYSQPSWSRSANAVRVWVMGDSEECNVEE